MSDRFDITRLDLELSKVITRLELPASNDSDMQQLLSDYHVGSSLEKRGKGLRDAAIKKLKVLFKDKIAKPTEEPVELMLARPFQLSAKVNNPRETFDKDAFIEKIADIFELSRFDLIKLAESTVKQSAAPVSFITSIVTDEEQAP